MKTLLQLLLVAASAASFPPMVSAQRVGDRLPAVFDLQSLDGEIESFAHSRGMIRIVNVWATWCRPCVLELPSLAAMADSLASEGVRVYAIAVDRPDRVRRFIRRGIATPPVWLEKDRVPREWGRWPMPTTWVIDGSDRLLHVHYGAASWNDRNVLANLRQLIRNGSRSDE